MSPRVSVLLPVRDAAPWLEAALGSLERQTFRDFEVVAVDDGSTDGCGEMLVAKQRQDERFRVFRRPPEGLVSALNFGLERCRAPLVARMDADDVTHTHRLARQVRALREAPGLDVVSCRVRCFPCTVVERGMRLYEGWLNSLLEHGEILRERFAESPIPNPTFLMRREWIERIGGWREGVAGERWPEDYDFWLRLAAAGARFGKVDQVLHFWREHPQRATREDPRYGKDRFLACKAWHLARGPLAAPPGSSTGRSVVVWGAGPTGRRLVRELERWGVGARVFVDVDPAKIGRRPRGVEVVAPEALPALLGGPEPPVVLAAVAARGGRQQVRERLQGLGLVEGEGFWCAA